MINTIDCWQQWKRLCSVTAHLKCDTIPPPFVWCELTCTLNVCQFMERLTKLEFSERIWGFFCFCFFSLHGAPGMKGPSPDNYTVQQRSHAPDLVFMCFSVFKKKFAWGFVVLHMWRLESDGGFFFLVLPLLTLFETWQVSRM